MHEPAREADRRLATRRLDARAVLLGTRGQEADWNRHESSRGHLAIPPPGWQFVASISSIFYVEDAGSARDDLGRNVIADQDFVRSYGVRSSFRLRRRLHAGEELRRRAGVRARARAPRVAERFAPLASILKTGTMGLVESGRHFQA